MMKTGVSKRLLMVVLLSSGVQQLHALWPTNLFDPYDILLMNDVPRDAWVQLDLTYEGAYNVSAFHEHRHGNVLQLWQDEQVLFSATIPRYL